MRTAALMPPALSSFPVSSTACPRPAKVGKSSQAIVPKDGFSPMEAGLPPAVVGTKIALSPPAPAKSSKVGSAKPTSLKSVEKPQATRKPLQNLPAFAEEGVDAILEIWSNPKYFGAEESTLPPLSQEQRAGAKKILLTAMSEFVAQYNGYQPTQTVDQATQTALVDAGLCSPEQAANFLNGNSDSDWSNLATPAGDMRAQLMELFDFRPSDEARGKAKHTLIGFLVRLLFECKRPDNIGATVLQGYDKPVVLFRSGTMVGSEAPQSTLRNLIGKGNVSNVVNLYAGHFPLHDLIAQEATLCEQLGVPHHNERNANPPRQWRKLLDNEEDYAANKERAMEIVSQVIKDILLPGGKEPDGNILLHCGGGMHRTGMIVGIIRRYCNNDAMEDIIADYKRHVAWKSDEDPGGYEELNVRFIREFDLGILKKVLEGSDASEPALAQSSEKDEWGYFPKATKEK